MLTIVLICIRILIIASAGQSQVSAATLGASIAGSFIIGVIATLICLAVIRYTMSLQVGQKGTASETAQSRATPATLTDSEAYGLTMYKARDPENTYDSIPKIP